MMIRRDAYGVSSCGIEVPAVLLVRSMGTPPVELGDVGRDGGWSKGLG